MQLSGLSFVLTDAKSFYNSSKSVIVGMYLSERRTAIEVAIVAERVKVMQAEWKWINFFQQLADGLTKPSAKDKFTEVLNRGNHQMHFDPNFTVAKKVTQKDREAQEKEFQDAANEQIFGFAEVENREKKSGECQLAECRKPIDEKNKNNKYCSRRHFYLDHHRKYGWSDTWKKSASMAMAIETAENVAGAEAARHEDVERNTSDNLLCGWMIVIFMTMMFLMIYFRFGHWFFIKFLAVSERNEFDQNDMISENVQAPINEAILDDEDASEENSDHENDIMFAETYARPSHVDPSEEQRWREAYETVYAEENQQFWREISQKILSGQHGHHARD